MKKEVDIHVPVRRMSPEWIFELDSSNFAPTPEMWDWIRRVFLDSKSQMFNSDHLYLRSFRYLNIAVMWANQALVNKDVRSLVQQRKS